MGKALQFMRKYSFLSKRNPFLGFDQKQFPMMVWMKNYLFLHRSSEIFLSRGKIAHMVLTIGKLHLKLNTQFFLALSILMQYKIK